MEFKRTEVKATIYGTEVNLRKPTYEEREEFIELIDVASKAEDTKQIQQIQKDLSLKLGLPKEVLKTMEADHVDQLLMELIGKKKS